MTLSEQKTAARKAAFIRRADADATVVAAANKHLELAVRATAGSVVSAYWPIRTELDPRPAIRALADTHEICLPVVQSAGQPLFFRRWRPGTEMISGPFGVSVPADEKKLTPEILIVPLAAFDATGCRLGYGGGFYDRTLEILRRKCDVTAIGFAYDIQGCDEVPREATDQRLDLIITESGATSPR